MQNYEKKVIESLITYNFYIMKWIVALVKFLIWLSFQAILLIGLCLFGGWLISIVSKIIDWPLVSVIILVGVVAMFIRLSKLLDNYL